MLHDRKKLMGILAGAAALVILLTWTLASESTSEVIDLARDTGTDERSPNEGSGSEPRNDDPTMCTLAISTTSMSGETLEGIEHCAYDLLLGRPVDCERSDHGGKAAIEWKCSKIRQVVLSSASSDWIAAQTALVSPAPDQPETVHVRMARSDLYLSGRVEDSLGGPIEGALVRTHCKDARSPRGSLTMVGVAGTDVNGMFRSGFPESCEVDSLEVSAPGYAATSHALTHDRDGIVVRLFPAGVIRGYVTNEDGPVSNPTVTLRGADGFDRQPPSARFAKTNELGEYIFDAVPPGLWVVSASADNQLGSYPSLIQLELGTAQEDINIKLLDGAAVQVLVSSELAASCAGGRLQISAEGMPAKTVATFEIVTEGTLYAEGLPPQALSAVLKCNGYSIIGSPPMHEIGYRWEPVLPEGVSVSGQVIDNDGEPAAGVAVWVKTAESKGGVPSGRTDDAGQFHIGGLATGPATVFAQAAKGPPANVEITIEDQGLKGLVISLPASIEVRGKVVSHGRGVGGFHVEATTTSSSCKTASDEGGTFSCVLASDAGPVDYRVTDHQAEVVGVARGTVGETVEINVETWALSGTVSAAEDGPFNVLADAFVEGRRVPTPLGVATDPTTGRFELSGLAMGASYWLTVRSMSGNSVSEGPYSNGDHATLELLELARLQLTAPCPGELGEMRIARSESSIIPLLAIPIRVSSDGVIEAVEAPAGQWHVELNIGAGRPVSTAVTLEAGATQTLNFESCTAASVP